MHCGKKKQIPFGDDNKKRSNDKCEKRRLRVLRVEEELAVAHDLFLAVGVA
jgi:hypothetical protein